MVIGSIPYGGHNHLFRVSVVVVFSFSCLCLFVVGVLGGIFFVLIKISIIYQNRKLCCFFFVVRKMGPFRFIAVQELFLLSWVFVCLFVLYITCHTHHPRDLGQILCLKINPLTAYCIHLSQYLP